MPVITMFDPPRALQVDQFQMMIFRRIDKDPSGRYNGGKRQHRSVKPAIHVIAHSSSQIVSTTGEGQPRRVLRKGSRTLAQKRNCGYVIRALFLL